MTDQRSEKKMGQWMTFGMWILLLGMLSYFFSGVLENQHNPNTTVAGRVTQEGVREITLQRNRFGHYVANGSINGNKVVFFLDTGATDVSVPVSVANRLGLKKGAPITFQTANGAAPGYLTTLDSVTLGNIQLNNIRASINPNVEFDEILLGMSFLKQLEFTQRGDTLTLRQY